VRLILGREHLQHIIDHVNQGYPYEVCGLIGGQFRGQDRTAEAITPIPNVAETPHHTFEMDHRLMVETILKYQRSGQDVVGIYHSHPDAPPRPSEIDIAQASWPDVVWLIVHVNSAGQTEITQWTIRYGKVTPAALEIRGASIADPGAA
jgi:proteasome lid subunit RPN8/RPN11